MEQFSISMILLPGYQIELRDTTQYHREHSDYIFEKYGRAYFIKYGDEVVASKHLSPMAESLVFNYDRLGRHDGYVFFFPWWDPHMHYFIGDIVVYNEIVGANPDGSPITDRGYYDGPAVLKTRLFKAVCHLQGQEPKPGNSEYWQYVDGSFDECFNAGNRVLVTANVKTSTIMGDRYVYKKNDYIYCVNLITNYNYEVEIYDINDLNNPIKSYQVNESFDFNTQELYGVKNPLAVMVVKIFNKDTNEYVFVSVYEITVLVDAVNMLVKKLYCIDNKEAECRDMSIIEEKKTRKEMTTIMALFQSLFFKINNSYAKSVFISSLSDNKITMLTEIQKEMKRLRITLKNLNYDT